MLEQPTGFWKQGYSQLTIKRRLVKVTLLAKTWLHQPGRFEGIALGRHSPPRLGKGLDLSFLARQWEKVAELWSSRWEVWLLGRDSKTWRKGPFAPSSDQPPSTLKSKKMKNMYYINWESINVEKTTKLTYRSWGLPEKESWPRHIWTERGS